MIFLHTIELSPRLKAVADAVPKGARVADIGTDHAYLPAYLLGQGVVTRLIASDVRSGPLRRAGETVRRYGYEACIDLRLCNGLAQIAQEEVDTVIIAGMGGEVISQILAAAPWTRACRLILQPMSSHPDLRRWLWCNGHQILGEHLVREGKVLYTIFTATGGPVTPFTAAETWAGKQKETDCEPLRSEYLARRIHQAEIECRGLKCATVPVDSSRLAQTEKILAALQEMKREWDAWQPSPRFMTF